MILKLFFSSILFIGATWQLMGQNFTANSIWEGKLGNIRLVLKVSEDSVTKQYKAVFDSPDQGAMGLEVSDLNITIDSLTAFSKVIGGGYYGAFNEDKTELTGEWRQGGAMPMLMKKVEKEITINRPQTPKEPFPYVERKVVYHNEDKSIQYGATLTMPDTNVNVPAVILISGSGQQDRDETLFNHKPFWVIADYFSRNGIVVLRVDDRGVGQTTGDVMGATSADFADDVLVSLGFLKKQQGIDINKMGLVGHSEGGMIAPMAAIKSNDVAFIVSLAGLGVTGMEIMQKQMKAFNKQLELNAEERVRSDEFIEMLLGLAAKHPDNEELKPIFAQEMQAWMDKQPDDFLMKMGFKGEEGNRNIDQTAGRFFMPWMRYFLKYDPAPILEQLKIPVLALNGEKDVQVTAAENLAGFERSLKKAGNENFKIMSFPNLNHLFQTAETGAVSEYMDIEETFSPQVLEVMLNWIRGL
ncbi:alpha/beta hydrolase [Sphingobacterium sp. UT-1RO-CII-1]|uniref:alpha/beta hydrolase family protein n=1 Tax=Sphingobacterium sp. UT-1RO-CII-1 TaxID=2995225 RepID=UPI00227B3A25|nr:alpha/beta hydrolase [Sphingobacterium sp. UT-1RO-CII-1]MCY4780768.1 alpha/beta hydrolase [Sphingobacterium sp. UT-1RO-CII-1]